MLSRSIAEDEALNRLSKEAHLLYLQCIPHVDRDGLITGRPAILWSRVLPLRVEFMDVAGQLIEEWVQQGLVVRYTGAKSEPVLFFKGFRRHNANIRYEEERPSSYPPPPGWMRTGVGLVPEDPQVCLQLAENFDGRSSYRKALLARGGVTTAAADEATEQNHRFAREPLGSHSRWNRQELTSNSRTEPESLGSSSRVSPEQLVYQDQTEDQTQIQIGGGGDQSIIHPSVWRGEGVGEGAWPGTHLLQFSDTVLRRAACELGPVLFGSDFRGYGAFVGQAATPRLVALLEWIAYFWDRGDQLEGISNLPGYVRGCLKRGDRPGLTTKQRQFLLAQIQQVQMQLV